MEKRRGTKIWNVPAGGVLLALLWLTVAFCLGSGAGVALAFFIDSGNSESLIDYIQSYIATAQSGLSHSSSFLGLAWESVRWPLLATLLGFTGLGVLLLPVLFAIRGFLLAFAIAIFIRLFGSAGSWLAFATFGVTGVFAVPVFFLMGVQSWMTARILMGRMLGEKRRGSLFHHNYLLRCGICAVVLALCIGLEYTVVPVLLTLFSTII